MNTVMRRFIVPILATSALLLSAQASAAGYEKIEPPQNTSTADKVEVMEFFWLGCPHCYQFEPTLAAWEKEMPDYVKFVREAPPLNPAWENHSRSFYAAQLLGQEGPFVEAMFKAIHEDRKAMRKPDDIADLAAELGMDKKKFLSTMKSFAVDTKMRRAVQLAKSAGITGVPSVVINGKYRTGAKVAGGYPGMVDTIKETTELEKQAMGLE